MAKQQAVHGHCRSRGIVLSLSLSFLLLTPLLLPGGASPVPAKPPSSTPDLAEPIIGSNPNPHHYDPNPAPLPGELIVRFKASYNPGLLQALRAANALNPDFQQTLVGAGLEGDQLYRAVPEVADFLRSYRVRAADAIIPEMGAYLLKIDPALEPMATAMEFAGSGFFDYAEANFPVYAFREPNDPLYRNQQPGLRQIGAPDAWDITTGSDNIVIAIVDSGIAVTHPELTGKVMNGMNFSADPANSNITDDNGHGTYVAGIAAANTNNSMGLAGVAWNARILPVKVLDADGQGSNATIAKGIKYASERGAQVINISLGGPNRSQVVEDATRLAFNQGAVLVASVGNSGTNQPNYPAAYSPVIGVGAINQRGEAASFSNFGFDLSITAPGTNVIGPWIGGLTYISDSGTSSAAPFVSGAAALMLSVNRGLTNIQVRNILEGTADISRIGDTTTPASGTSSVQTNSLTPAYDTRLGWGRLNLFRAVQAAQRGDLYPVQRPRISGDVMGLDPLDVVLTLQPGDSRVPDASGLYSFENLPPGTYTLRLESKKYGIVKGPQTFQIRGTDGEYYLQDYNLGSDVKEAMTSGKPVGAFRTFDPNQITPITQRFFDATGHTIKDKFLKFWLEHGDLRIFGYPISEEFQERNPDDGKSYKVQYFERVIFEYHPEYAGTTDEIQIRRLGSERAKGRTDKEFDPVLPPALQFVDGKLAQPFYSTETRHTLRGKFLQYWNDNGKVPVFGLPISEEMEENGRQVQYFERYRMEIHPENAGGGWEVIGSLLAHDSAQLRGFLGQNS